MTCAVRSGAEFPDPVGHRRLSRDGQAIGERRKRFDCRAHRPSVGPVERLRPDSGWASDRKPHHDHDGRPRLVDPTVPPCLSRPACHRRAGAGFDGFCRCSRRETLCPLGDLARVATTLPGASADHACPIRYPGRARPNRSGQSPVSYLEKIGSLGLRTTRGRGSARRRQSSRYLAWGRPGLKRPSGHANQTIEERNRSTEHPHAWTRAPSWADLQCVGLDLRHRRHRDSFPTGRVGDSQTCRILEARQSSTSWG
jgi:hypothetical protein